MKKIENEKKYWIICLECDGTGKKKRKLSKKDRVSYQIAIAQFEKNKSNNPTPVRPKAHLYNCLNCSGSGLVSSTNLPIPDKENYPHVAIIGGGIGGVALAVACLHRKIPFTLYERDCNFESRSQGYGLTLQQASKAIAGLGILSLTEGVVSTKHIVHTTEGKVIGEWGMRKWVQLDVTPQKKRSNVHIARQSLRLALLEQLVEPNTVQWGHQFINYNEYGNQGVTLNFQVNGKIKTAKADLVVGADGIRSSVRSLLIGDANTPLQYLGCMVILGICKLNSIEGLASSLLDSATVFQTANGKERIYVMPYSLNSVMWQLSFPISENEALKMTAQGAQALKEEACRRAQWHHPIPQILTATLTSQVSGYPVYDRELLHSRLLEKSGSITLIGDAAHPMSPFKGQGANQALLDALILARTISKQCGTLSHWKKIGIRKKVIEAFESEMILRTSSKVKDSAAAAQLLHSEIVLQEGDAPRGRFSKNNSSE